MEKIYERILFCVIQSGTELKNGINTGNYSCKRLAEMINVCKKYEKLSKEHNGDYMKKDIMTNRFALGLDSMNIAPELGVFETKLLLDGLVKIQDNKMINLFYELCHNSGKWKKWVSDDFNPEINKIKLIEICGHYIFSNTDFQIIKTIKSSEYIIYEMNKKIIRLYSSH